MITIGPTILWLANTGGWPHPKPRRFCYGKLSKRRLCVAHPLTSLAPISGALTVLRSSSPGRKAPMSHMMPFAPPSNAHSYTCGMRGGRTPWPDRGARASWATPELFKSCVPQVLQKRVDVLGPCGWDRGVFASPPPPEEEARMTSTGARHHSRRRAQSREPRGELCRKADHRAMRHPWAQKKPRA